MSPKLKRRLQYNFCNKQGSIVNQSSAGLTIFCYPELKSFYFGDLSLDPDSCEQFFLPFYFLIPFYCFRLYWMWWGLWPGQRERVFFFTSSCIFIFSTFFWVVEQTQGDEVVKEPSFFDPEHWELGTTCRYKYRKTVTEIHKHNDSMWGTLTLKKIRSLLSLKVRMPLSASGGFCVGSFLLFAKTLGFQWMVDILAKLHNRIRTKCIRGSSKSSMDYFSFWDIVHVVVSQVWMEFFKSAGLGR